MKLKLTLLLVVAALFSFGQASKMEQLGKLYMSGNFEESIRRAKEYLEEEPNNIDYHLILGRALTDYGEYEEAIPHLKFTVENDSNNSWRKAWALGYLGSCYYMVADYEKSKQYLQQSVELNATSNATNYATTRFVQFGYHRFFNDWETVETENFSFHFQKMDEKERQDFIHSRESAFFEINDFFETELPKKIDFYVWDSREDAQKILRANLGFSISEFCVIHSHYQQTRGHEMTHVISNYVGKNIIKTGLINEGTAVCFNLDKQDKTELVVKWLEKNEQEVDIKAMWLGWEDFPGEFAYPMAGIFVEELIKTFGKERFLNFFVVQTYDHAKEVFGDDLETLIANLEDKINTGGK
jgi:tetratricopeptide (TPR) repeat protein